MNLTSTTAPESTTGNSTVSLNDEWLSYDRPTARGRTILGRLPQPLAAAATIVAVLAAVGLLALTATAVGANDGEATIKAVHFDLTEREVESSGPLEPQGSENPARYRSLVVEYGGVEIDLAPLTGSINVTLSQADTASFTADLDGSRIGAAAPNFADSLADGAGSAEVQRYVSLAGGSDATIDLTYSRPLGAGDFLLVQELDGDAPVVLTGLDAQGATVGAPVTVGPTYQWNTGHSGSTGGPAWATVIPVARFGAGDQPVSVIRVSGADAQSPEAEFKVVALGPAPMPAAVTEPVVDDETAPESSTEVDVEVEPTTVPAHASAETLGGVEVAAIGVEVKIQPALAVDGAGCANAGDQSVAGVATGQPATYCFVVTNEGTTHLDDVTITDGPLGLDSVSLPRVDGQGPIAPGDQAVFYHHGSVAERSSEDATVATARPIGVDGGPVDGLISAPVATAQSLGEDGPTLDEAPAVLANVAAEEPTSAPIEAPDAPVSANSAGDEPMESLTEPPAQLALTGMVTEPWVLVIFAMAFIFVGHTIYVAFAQQNGRRGPVQGRTQDHQVQDVAVTDREIRDVSRGHSQLDALGFD